MKKTISKLLLTITGIFWILFTTYRYVFLQRETLVLQENNNTTYKVLLLIFLLLNLSTLLLHKNNKIKDIFNKAIDFIYWKPLMYIFNSFFKEIDGVGDVLLFLAEKIIDIYKILRNNFGNIMCFIFFVIPKTILVFAYFLDVFFFNQLYYFIKLIPAMVIYLIIMRILVYILKDFSLQNKIVLEDYLEIKNQNGSSIITLRDRYYNANNLKNLSMFASRYGLFVDVSNFCNLILSTEVIINKWLTPLILYLYTLGTLKILLISSGIIFNAYYYHMALLFSVTLIIIKVVK